MLSILGTVLSAFILSLHGSLPQSMPKGTPVSGECHSATLKVIREYLHVATDVPVRHSGGIMAWLPVGAMSIDLTPCKASTRLGGLSVAWDNQNVPLELFIASGSVRYLKLSRLKGKAMLTVRGADGHAYTLTPPKDPCCLGILFYGARPSVRFSYPGETEEASALYVKGHTLHQVPVFEGGPRPPP
jgi:hypothetical protein